MKYKTIVFEDGSNTYICKTVEEFEKMSNKYDLEPTGTPDFYVKRKEKQWEKEI